MNIFGKPGILATTACKQRIQGAFSKYSQCMSIFYRNLGSVYSPKQELSLDEAIIPWRGRLAFRTYNPGKKMKYGLLVRMVCEAVSGYICNLEIYAAEGKKLQDTVVITVRQKLGPQSPPVSG